MIFLDPAVATLAPLLILYPAPNCPKIGVEMYQNPSVSYISLSFCSSPGEGRRELLVHFTEEKTEMCQG